MGQQAAQGTPVGRQLYLRDVAAFVRGAGIDPALVERKPAMDPHVNVRIDDPETLDAFRARLAGLRVGGREIVWSEGEHGFFSLEFGQADDAIGDITVDGEARTPEALGFEIVEIEDEVASTGYHVPEGVLLAYDPSVTTSPDTDRTAIPTTAIASMILDRLDVPSEHATRAT